MRRRLIILLALLCLVGAGLWSVTINRRAANADTISTMVSGSAYGLSINAANGDTSLSSGPFGGVSTICTPYPTNQQNTLLGLDLFQGLLTSTTIHDQLTFTQSFYKSTAEATSTIEKLTIGQSLLGPLVEVDGLHAVARSTALLGSATSVTSSSFFGSIKIAGLNLPLIIAPNTRISLLGLGTIVLNEQIVQNIGPVTTYAEVNMVDITLGLDNVLHQPAGTHILIGHTVSTDSVVSVLAGMQAHAYGLYTVLHASKLANIQLGPIPDTEIGCTGGTDYTSANLSVPLLVGAGIAETQATGVINGSTVAVSSSERITDLSLLGGLIQAGLLQEDAHAIYQGTHGTSYGSFNPVNLRIGGLNILPNPHMANDRVNLPGFGYVIIDEVVPTNFTVGFAINALDVVITTSNILDLAVGLHIIVGHVDAGISVFN